MKEPKISVIMSVHNGLPYLKQAVESILHQTYRNFEFIIVEDKSTDNTLKYLKGIEDKRVKLIENKKKLGLASSLNKALKLARGAYIARMDADDISMPQRFTTQLNYMLENTTIDICGTWVDTINEKGTIKSDKKYPTEDRLIKKALARYQPIVHPTFMVKRTFFTKLGGYRKDYDYAEDYDLLVRAMEGYKMANIPAKLLRLRLSENRRSRKDMKKMDIIDLKIKLQILKKNYFGPLYLFLVVGKFITTFLIPQRLKLKIAKVTKLA